ncbi:MAG: hypothetical protein ABI417_08975 [Coleofasciculaceae cyanobacterium]
MDNLLTYLSNQFGSRLAVSGETGDLLVWGERVNNDIRLLGLSYNTSTTSQALQENNHPLLSSGNKIAQQINLPLVRIIYPANLNTDPNSALNIDGERVEREEASAKIQHKFGTQYKLFGTTKLVNRSTNDAFQDWARVNLPQNYIRIDLDAILHVEDQKPALIIEVKRSTQVSVQRWEPYIADIRNYYIVDLLAKKAGLKFITLNHAYRDSLVSDESIIGIHNIQKISLEPQVIKSTKLLIKAKGVVTHLINMSS